MKHLLSSLGIFLLLLIAAVWLFPDHGVLVASSVDATGKPLLIGGLIINSGTLAALYRAFNTAFQKGFTGMPPMWNKVASLVPSGTGTEDYGWLGQVPGMREWLGDRQIQNLALHSYSIKNKDFESTVGVKRPHIEDDQLGIYSPMFEMMGQNASEHPDTLVFALLAAGFDTKCYDNQYFFDTDHPVIQADKSVASVSNVQAGAGAPWFLLDTRRPLKPVIYQERKKPTFVSMDKETDANVFNRNEYVYGVDSRCNVGFGFWQMAFGSKADLDTANFEAAYDAMGAFKGDHGKQLGIRPNLLVVGPSNASAARKIVEAQLVNGGDSNTNFKRVELLECPWLA